MEVYDYSLVCACLACGTMTLLSECDYVALAGSYTLLCDYAEMSFG